MSIFRKFLKDKAGNTIIPYVDKGGFPEDAVYHDDPTTPEPDSPWITESMIDKNTFRSTVTSGSDSITIPAGKWFIMHTFDINQTSAAAASVFIYNLGNADASNDTWAVPSGAGQNVFAKLCRIVVKEFSSTTTCTISRVTATNVTTTSQSWVAIPII